MIPGCEELAPFLLSKADAVCVRISIGCTPGTVNEECHPHHSCPHRYSSGLLGSALHPCSTGGTAGLTHQFFGSSEILFCERCRIRSFSYLQWIYLSLTSNTSGLRKMARMKLDDIILRSL